MGYDLQPEHVQQQAVDRAAEEVLYILQGNDPSVASNAFPAPQKSQEAYGQRPPGAFPVYGGGPSPPRPQHFQRPAFGHGTPPTHSPAQPQASVYGDAGHVQGGNFRPQVRAPGHDD